MAAVAAYASGRSGPAVDALHQLVDVAPVRVGARAIDALLALHRVQDARRALDTLRARTDDAGLDVVEARLLLAEGHLRQARAILEAVPQRGAAALRATIEGELDALDPHRRLPISAPSGIGVRNVRGVMHVVTTSQPERVTGYTVRTQGIAAAQRSAGLDVVVVPRIGYPVDVGHLDAAEVIQVDGVRHHRLLGASIPRQAGPRLDVTVTAVTRLLDSERVDLIHAHSKHHNAQVGLGVGRARGLPVVYEVRGFLEETWRSRGGDPASDWYRLSREAETTCMRMADAVVTLSQSMREEVVGRGVPVEAVHVVPNAVDAAFLAPASGGRGIRERLGIPSTSVVIGFSGTINAYEGLPDLLVAIAALEDQTVHVLVVGGGPALADARAAAQSVADRAHFVGQVSHGEVPAYLDAMDLYVVPRLVTPVTVLVPPLKPIEALAVGVPVLASDLPPLREVAEGTDSMVLVSPGDPAKWTEALDSLLGAGPLRPRGADGRRWVARERSWARAAESYQRVYRSAASRAATRARR